ncbi:M16 family metallopeptidase [Blattabacterium cuenoti]|uniref:M16 family metallopeptidase n=1 Tax=Blattabacterium cuenoti TaxID=1653831 RepID=UPI00163C677F|nr:pitrilysin family protein [Blattabacterium cuenoti]
MESNYKISFLEEKLLNGLHVFYYQDKTNPLISTSVLYHVGSKDEDPGKTGFAHFFEHLMFEGSKNIKKGDYFKYVASNGGQNNAYTSQDETYYYEILPSDCLPLALWMESERMYYANVDKESIDIQRKIIKEEKKTRVDNQPYIKALSEVIPALLFKKHPYRYPIIGFNKDLDNATEEDYNKFYEKYYIPSNAILVISGDFEIEEAKELVKKYFSQNFKNKKLIKKEIPKEESINKEIITTYIDKNTKVPGVFLSYRIPEMINKDFYALKIIDNILSSGESSRIISNIVNDKQIAVYAGSFLDSMEDYSMLTIYGILYPNVKVERLLEGIDKEIDMIIDKGITQYELDKQMNFFERKSISDNYFISGVSSNLSHYYLYYKNANLINNEIDNFKKVTIQDVQKVASKYLIKNNRVRLYNLPEKK